MALHLTKKAAREEATDRLIKANKKAQSGRHSSGHTRLRYDVVRRFGVLWGVRER